MTAKSLPPVERSISVAWDQETAFRRFALEFGQWWPSHTHSVGGSQVRRVVLEPRIGGRIYEELKSGRRFQWGCILEWEPPTRLVFSFHPSRAAETAQRVEVRFVPNAGGTRVALIATGWENWSPAHEAPRARRGYSMGWNHLLYVWAEQRGVNRTFGDVLILVAKLLQRLRGGDAATIAQARGEIAPLA